MSDDHAGLKRAVAELLPEAVWQRCYVHFLRNALDYLPRKADDDCRQELRWLYDRRDLKKPSRACKRGSSVGPSAIRGSPTGSKPTSARRSTSTGYHVSTTNTSNRPTCLNGSTRKTLPSQAPGARYTRVSSCSGKYPSPEVMVAAYAVSGAEMLTVAVCAQPDRREGERDRCSGAQWTHAATSRFAACREGTVTRADGGAVR